MTMQKKSEEECRKMKHRLNKNNKSVSICSHFFIAQKLLFQQIHFVQDRGKVHAGLILRHVP